MTNLRIGIPSKGRLAEAGGRAVEGSGAELSPPGSQLVCRAAATCRSTLRSCAPRTFPCYAPRGRSTWGSPAATWWPNIAPSTIERLAAGRGPLPPRDLRPRERRRARSPRNLAGRRIATSFPNTTQEYLEKASHHGPPGAALGLGRGDDRPGRGRRHRRPGRDRQHAGRQWLEDSRRDRPLSNRADSKSRVPTSRIGRSRRAPAGRAW